MFEKLLLRLGLRHEPLLTEPELTAQEISDMECAAAADALARVRARSYRVAP